MRARRVLQHGRDLGRRQRGIDGEHHGGDAGNHRRGKARALRIGSRVGPRRRRARVRQCADKGLTGRRRAAHRLSAAVHDHLRIAAAAARRAQRDLRADIGVAGVLAVVGVGGHGNHAAAIGWRLDRAGGIAGGCHHDGAGRVEIVDGLLLDARTGAAAEADIDDAQLINYSMKTHQQKLENKS